jgi:RNA polymerase primary sigma factor
VVLLEGVRTLNWRWIFFINILIVCVHLRAPGIGIASAVADNAKIAKCVKQISARARLDEILEAKWDWLRVYMHSPEFDTPEAKEGWLPSSSGVDVALLVATRSEGFWPEGVREPVPGLLSSPLLVGEEEEALLREMNYLKFRANNEIEGALGLKVITHPMVDNIESLIHRALKIRNVLVLANMRLVQGLVRDWRSPLQYGETFSSIQESMEHAIDRFDYERGNKIVTYVTSAVMRNRAKDRAREARRNGRQMDELLDEDGEVADYFENIADPLTDIARIEALVESLCASIEANLEYKDQRIIKARFGVCGEVALTLEELGREFGITKQRVLQLQRRAEEKLRERADPEFQSFLPRSIR